jgi:undecaprenyl-diphosphatase
MEYLQAIVLALIHGVTEFLPISSSAHQIIFRDIFGWNEVLCGQNAALGCIPRSGWSKTSFDSFGIGSFIAVLLYFWYDIVNISKGAWQAYQTENWQREEWKVFWGIAIGSCPALFIGLAFKISGIRLESPVLIAVMSIIMAMLLGLAEEIGTRARGFDKLKVNDGILVGMAQTIALLPGASHSGSTITAALFLGLRRHTAARFSFLLGIPTLALSTLAQTKEVIQHRAISLPLIVGILATIFFSYVSIDWFLKFLQKQSSWIFVWYRLAFGISILSAYVIYGQLPSLVQQ